MPFSLALLLLVWVLLVFVVLLCAVAAPWSSRKRSFRIATFGLAYCSMELAVIPAAGSVWLRHLFPKGSTLHHNTQWILQNQILLSRALDWVLHAGNRCFDFKVNLTDSSQDAVLSEPDPVLLLARHGGIGDSFVLVHLLLTKYRRGIRIVLKDILQVDPALDLLLNRLGCVFLSSNASEGGVDQLATLAGEMGPGDTLLIFPEGANWTPNRRRRSIRKLRREHHTEAARTAALMDNVLPPRPAGIMACLDANSDLQVTIAAHAGLDRMTTIRQVWDALPLKIPMTVRIWPTSPPPGGLEERLDWLTLEWAIVNQWIDSYHAGSIDQPTQERLQSPHSE